MKRLGFGGPWRAAIFALAVLATVTNWYPDQMFVRIFDACVFLVAAGWALARVHEPVPVRMPGLPEILAWAIVVWGLLQLGAGTTVYRFETSVATLHWAALATVLFLAAQLYEDPEARVGLRLGLLYFGFALSVVSVMQLFTAEGNVFWLFPTKFKDVVMGPFLNHDHYAAFVELVLPIAMLEAVASKRHRVAYAVMAATLFASVVAGASRAGTVLATVEVGLISLLALWRRTGGTRVRAASLVRIVALAGAFTAVVGWEVVWQRFQERDPLQGRREIYISTLAMIRERPGMGFGLGTFESVYPAHAIFDTGLTVNHAHNDWLEWAAEGGVPLLLIMAALGALSMRAAWAAPWAIGVVFVLLHCAVDFPMHSEAIPPWMFILLGAAIAAKRHRKPFIMDADAT